MILDDREYGNADIFPSKSLGKHMEGLYLFFSSQVGLGVGLSHSRENLIGQKSVCPG